MLRRVLVLAVMMASLAVAAPSLNAETGVGIQFGEPGNVGLSLRFDNIAIGAAWGFGDNGYLHVTADYWLMKNDLAKNLDWFLGLGADVGIGDPFTLAARVPIGLQWMPAKDWEIFGQVAPGLQIINEVDFYFGGAIGVRYIF